MNHGDIKLVIDQLEDIDLSVPYEQVVINNAVTMLETLGNKVAGLERNLAEEQRDYKEVEAMLHSERDVSQSLREKVAEQAAVIEKLRGELEWQKERCYNEFEPDNQCYAYKRLCKALAIPTDSKQILIDWMREQLGEPVGYFYQGLNGDGLRESLDPVVSASHTPLFKLPECLR